MNEYSQKNLFEEEYPQYKITKPIRLIETFAGISAQSMALKRLGVEFERWRCIEFDEFAIKSYNAICGTNFPAIDIRDVHASDLGIVDRDKYEYILTYSFPCQALSLAGKQAGNSIVCGVLCALFSQLGIQNHKRWNEMSLEERRALVYKGTVLEGKK